MQHPLSAITRLVRLAALAAPSVALAQSSVTIDGRIDLSVDHVSTGAKSNVGYGVPSTSTTRMNDGTSRLRFAGVEDLGGDLRAVFGLELGINADEGTLTTPAYRHSFVGMRNDWGTFVLGRLDSGAYSSSPAYSQAARNVSWVVHDAGVVAIGTRILNGRNRVSNAMSYISPTVAGLNVTARLNLAGPDAPSTTNPAQTSQSDLRQYQVAVNYDYGALRSGVAYGWDWKAGGMKANDFRTKVQAVVSYDFGVAKPYALWGRDGFENTATSRRDVTYWLVGANVPMGRHGIVANYMQRDVQAAVKGSIRKAQVGYTYSLSKRSQLYAFYDRDDSDSSTSGAAVARGYGFGMQHRF
jgi:predicted porin